MSIALKNKGRTRRLAEIRIKKKFFRADPAAEGFDLSTLTFKELKILLAENIRSEVMTLEERVKEVLDNRLIKVKIRAIRLAELEDYANKKGSMGVIGLLDDILEVWSKKIKYGRGWR